MFTGLVQQMGMLQQVTQGPGEGLTWVIACETDATWQVGESVAVDGVCLTVVACDEHGFQCALSPETLDKGQGRRRQVGDCLNLERALRVGDRLGGHWVTGHVDGCVTLVASEKQDDWVTLTLAIEPGAGQYLLPKGSLCLHGVSLTINEVGDEVFTLMLIPHTANHTTLLDYQAGDRLHVEYDLMAKWLERQSAFH